MKIGRNSPCPCGSGLKYKKCCLNKTEEQKLGEAISASMLNIKNEARIKRCLHPKQDECQGKIVKAHAIQNNRILNKLAENGMVVTLDGALHYVFKHQTLKGVALLQPLQDFVLTTIKLFFKISRIESLLEMKSNYSY